MDVYQLVAEFVLPDGTGRQFEILFKAADDEAAKLAAWKWVRNRQQAGLPDVFGPIGALKVYPYPIDTPEENGFIRTGGSFHCYEWKSDYGEPPLVDGINQYVLAGVR
jgi:hypothetical protein